ncbi:DNA repair protein [Salmonella enterica subsp. enterica serovar Typhimurium]|uniref:inovirus Gp2 family protein n=1 Tax=Salmonella enterica TaxID=28901 RepID=UPI000779C9D7|nr:inovirus Gp2 family protein [Salmonella enterica]EJJ4045593.1 inovirus Gp2 family protein [Salmonella enterica]EJJ4059040.1 inovirus Gp2 family protein [Salmonella enterica]EJJ4064007.1 inovirus Gp2 family protein [Salmonella enterica]EJJ4092031.1 inovirus Gp2 family protein [Salmonella enterica]EJJ4421239.1 inovirus Gp2 family protein [Salmonella enterica]
MKENSSITHNFYYLSRFRSTLYNALIIHPRTLLVRVDLRFPDDYGAESNKAIEAFTPAIKSRLVSRYKRDKKKRSGQQVHLSKLNYIWVREHNRCGKKVHYHALLMFNKDVFWTIGKLGEAGNLADLIINAWLSALGLTGKQYRSLVHFPDHACYHLNRAKLSATDDIKLIWQRLDYMAKHRTKVYSKRNRTLGCSAMAGNLEEEEEFIALLNRTFPDDAGQKE